MKVFLSHSSKDKLAYCNQVAEKLIKQLGKEAVIYDQITFEPGEKAIDEMNRTLDITDLYVIFLSESSVERYWVKYELMEAYRKLTDKTLNRIYPIIIDPLLKFSDERIPEWLKQYNLKYIARPTKAAKLIVERAKDVKWKLHPEDRNKRDIFVGRNELVADFESRIDAFDKPPLNTFILSGIPNIGRKSLARHCFVKGSIIPQYYDFPTISLSYQESIEDFILKIGDLGFTNAIDVRDVSSKTLEEKIECAKELTSDISNLSEVVLIKDDGCIVDYRGNISDWFSTLIAFEDLIDRMVFVVITKYRMNYESIRNVPSASYLNVPELNQQERRGLLKRLNDTCKLDLRRKELEEISKHLSGYPAQVHYAIDCVKEKGYPYLSRNFKLLADYNEQEVSSLLERHKDNPETMEVLALVAKYDALSVTMLYEILGESTVCTECFEKLLQESFFELEGLNKEYIRLNEVVRNYVLRSGAKVRTEHRQKAQKFFEKMFSDSDTSWYDANDYLLAIRELVTQGKHVDTKEIIPSVYLKSMSDMYTDMQYENVVRLARLALDNSGNTDRKILYEIRYTFCSALAKLKDVKFLEEVKNLDNDDQKFLKAFYYRQMGRNDQALNYLDELLKRRPDMSKAKREKVLVLKNLQQFEEATSLAKENFYQYSENPYHIQAYFDCLINTYHAKPEDELLEELLEKLARINSEKAQSMYARCNALFLAYVEGEYQGAIECIDDAIIDFPKDKKYALVVKFEIARLFKQLDVMEEIIKSLEADNSNGNTIVICRSKLMADQNRVEEAKEYFCKHIKSFSEQSKKAFCDKLKMRNFVQI